MGGLETVDFLLTKAARLDKALKSLPKADRKTLHTSSHKRARKLLRNLSFPAKVSELTDENIENQIDVLTTVKSSVVSFAKKMPPLSDALTVGPDAMAVRACALEAREGLAEDLCSEEISKTGASLDFVDALSLLADPRGKPWPDLPVFSEYYETPPHLRPPRRSLPRGDSLPALPMRPTIGGIEDATQVGRFPDLLPALLKSAAGTLPEATPAEPRKSSKQNIFHASAVYRDACKRCKVQVLETMPILGEMVEVVSANLEETKHCYALAEAVKACAVKGLKVEDCDLPDMGAAKIIEAAFSGEHLETVTLSGLTLSYRSVLALYSALRQNRLGTSLRHLSLAACGLGGDLELMPPGAVAAYEKGRALLETHPVDEETLARGGDVAGLLSEHLQESLRKAKLDERPALHMATATSFASDGEDEVEKEEEEESPLELPPPPVLLPVFHQMTQSRVRHLNLSQTWLSPSSVRALSNSLPQTQIEVIKLDDCGLSDDAVEELALQGLLRSRLLLEVSLRRNQLSGNPGAISTLFHAVRIHARIAHLDLAENLMHPECVPELSKLLRHSVSLLCLHLLGCEDSHVEDTLAIQGACYRWVAQNAAANEHLEPEEIDIPEPAQGEEHSEVILCRAPHLDAKDWQVAAPRPKPMRRHDEESATPWEKPKASPATPEKSVFPEGCWIEEARQANVKFQIPEGVSGPEQVTPEEIDDWSQGPARIQALSECCEEDVKIIYLKDVCHVDDEEAVKEALWSKYDLYYECYALFAGRSQWPFVRYVDMFSVFEEAKVVDRSGRRLARMEKRRLHMQDIHVMITQTLANHGGDDAPEAEGDRGPKKKIVPEGNPLTRPQFCEVMLRAAISWGDDLSASAAIRLFADEIVAGHLLQPPLAPFPRGLALRPGDYNDALQNSSRTLKEAWERFGYSSVAFQRLAQLVRLCDRSFTAKHVASIYTLAKVPVVDDRVSTAGDTRGLSYSEFLEAVGRLAMVWSRSSWMPACCPQEDGSMRGRRWPPQPQAGVPVKERILAQRLQAFVQRLAERMRPSVKGRLA